MKEPIIEYLDNLVITHLNNIKEDLEISPGMELMNRCIGAAEAFRELGLIPQDVCDDYISKYIEIYLTEMTSDENVKELINDYQRSDDVN